jgi:hypothetical protein
MDAATILNKVRLEQARTRVQKRLQAMQEAKTTKKL